MKGLVVSLCALVAALPVGPAFAAAPAARLQSQAIPVSFACAPGGPIIHHQRLQREFHYAIAPGQARADLLAVVNVSQTRPVRLHLAVADAVTPPRGAGITFNVAGPQHALGRWLHLGVSALSVAPRQYALIPLRLSVPTGTRPGEYIGAISATDQHAVVVRQGRRTAIIHVSVRCDVVLRVMGPAAAGFKIVRAALLASYRHTVLALTLHNTGTVIDYPLSTVLAFVGTHMTYTLRPRINPVLSGAATTVAWPLGHVVPPGAYHVRIQIIYLASPTYGAPARQLQATWRGAVVIPA